MATVQACPQLPQLSTSVCRLFTQPLPVQLPYGALQTAHPQLPPMQFGVPLVQTQTLPHVRQLLTSALTFVSQPSATLRLQSAEPAVQLIVHTPLEQTGVPPTLLHAVPQAPQLLTSLSGFDSQPVAALPSQSLKPVAHWPILQAAC